MFKTLIPAFMLVLALASAGEAASAKDDYFYESLMTKESFTMRKPDKVFDLRGFKEFSLLARLEGGTNAEISIEIRYGNDILLYTEKITLNAQGWVNFARVYPVHSPLVRISVPDLPARISGEISVYAGH